MLVLNGGSAPSDKGGRGDDQPDPEIRGTPVSKKYFFGPVWFKNKGGGAGPPSLSPGSATGSIRRPRDVPAVFCKT